MAKLRRISLAGGTFFLTLLLSEPGWAVDHFVSPGGGNVPPFLSWDTAATNVQDAIDAASAGDVVWVTNGVYASGGKVMAGDLTNRVVLDKALSVQSVNGPFVTTIQGAWDPATTNGPLAVRCAWLTNGATLTGFTLQGGATRTNGDTVGLQSGGGVLCSSASAVVANCVIESNAASFAGGGVYLGTVQNAAILNNLARTTIGGAYNSILNSCTIVSNRGGGTFSGRLTNCIVYYNTSGNANGGTLSFCCTTPASPGNLLAPPQLLSDGIHLAATSPCLAAGTNVVTGADIDNQPWANPPSIGCDQWHGLPVIVAQPKVAFMPDPVGFKISLAVGPEDPFVCGWLKDGVPIQDDGHYNGSQTTNLVVIGPNQGDGGAYQVVLTNAFGVVTSAVAQVGMHFANSAGTSPLAPYQDWTTAATNIQDAIEASQPGDIVLVTNGVYANGGKVMAGDLTNRVVLDKVLLVQSINGALITAIQGTWDPATTNGPSSVRCAWMTNGAILSGFTLRGGATRNVGDSVNLESGGGIWGSSSNAIVVNSVVSGNSAAFSGGGAFGAGLLKCALNGNVVFNNSGTFNGGGAGRCNLTNCTLSGNLAAASGGGADTSYLKNCSVTQNTAFQNGGGINGGTLINCTVAWNTAGGSAFAAQGGGANSARLTNCIVYGNQCLYTPNASTSNYYSFAGAFNHCCTMPAPAGVGNIAADPQFLADGLHLATGSPCIGAGLASAATGTDIDGQSWQTSPSIGCDEWHAEPFVIGTPQMKLAATTNTLNVSGITSGQTPFSYFWLKDGGVLSESSKYVSSQTPDLAVQNFGPGDSGAYQLVASNIFGIMTSAVARVVVHCVNAGSTTPTFPYSDWSHAAANVQDGIDAAGSGDFVLITNGIYSAGGRVMAGDLTNRMVVNLPIVVASVNGPATTIIQGAWDPGTTNGPQAVRCAWIGDGAKVQGVTLFGGATRSSGDFLALESGGGAWCTSTNAFLIACILSNNASANIGGGCYQGALRRSIIWGNRSLQGGGAYGSFLQSCLVNSNVAVQAGGGVSHGVLINCTVTANQAPSTAGGGVNSSMPINSIVFYNFAPGPDWAFNPNDWDFSSKSQFISSWTTVSSYDHTTPVPQLTDGIHLASTSPCIAAGNPIYASGTDIDGESWQNPPSIGCDQFYPTDASGPLQTGPLRAYNGDGSVPVIRDTTAFVGGSIIGDANHLIWDFGDGTILSNTYFLSPTHTWTNSGDFNLSLTAFNYDNPAGVTTNLLVHVVLPNAPLLSGATQNGTNFILTFPSQFGVTYLIDETTNLAPPVTWQTLRSVFSIGKSVSVTDPAATNAAGFYRVRIQ